MLKDGEWDVKSRECRAKKEDRGVGRRIACNHITHPYNYGCFYLW